MKRPDLDFSGDYDGFQAVDGTPQERSIEMSGEFADKKYRCGPASVVAIKRGEILKPYDNAFLFAEVNADRVVWLYNGRNQPLKLLRKEILSVGQKMSTKAIDRDEREDVTDSYKFEETTKEERSVMLKALKLANSPFAHTKEYIKQGFNEVSFHFELRDDILIGEDFQIVCTYNYIFCFLLLNVTFENLHF
jgi:transglutaminase 1